MSAELAATGNGVAETPQTAATEKTAFSWLQPHPVFVIILVGPDEQPFGMQKDFLCHRSDFYRDYFGGGAAADEALEHVVRLPDFSAEVFGLAQHYLYTGGVMAGEAKVPSYESLVALWKLGHRLGVDGLCDKTLEAMRDCRRLTERIPATPLLIQVWRDTPKGSSIRLLLLSWAAEYMRSSEARADFAKSLPQHVLSELVVAMSSFDASPPAAQGSDGSPAAAAAAAARKNVHYLDDASDDESPGATKKRRSASAAAAAAAARTSLAKPQRRRPSAAHAGAFSTAQKLEFCADLLNRMLSGPGFWTRLVGPFKDPVEPVEDGVPDYLDKVKRPMDLSTVKARMDAGAYGDEDEFARDVRQIFDNCFTYWSRGDAMWAAGEKLQRTFEDKYSHMNKWIAKMGGDEGE